MNNPLVLLWSWRYGSPAVIDDCEDVEEAIRRYGWMMDSGECATDVIEVWDEDGYRLIDESEATRLALDEQDRYNKDHPMKVYNHVAWIWIKHHDEKDWALLGNYEDRGKAESEYARLKPILDSRVLIKFEQGSPGWS